jgi:hypothetical protein
VVVPAAGVGKVEFALNDGVTGNIILEIGSLQIIRTKKSSATTNIKNT